MPEDAQPGKPINIVATIIPGEDGMLTLSEVDGSPIESEETTEGADETAAEKEAPEMEAEESSASPDAMMARAKAAGLMK